MNLLLTKNCTFKSYCRPFLLITRYTEIQDKTQFASKPTATKSSSNTIDCIRIISTGNLSGQGYQQSPQGLNKAALTNAYKNFDEVLLSIQK